MIRIIKPNNGTSASMTPEQAVEHLCRLSEQHQSPRVRAMMRRARVLADSDKAVKAALDGMAKQAASAE